MGCRPRGKDMTLKKKRINLTIFLLLAFAALIMGLFVSQNMPKKNTPIDSSRFHGTLLNKAREIGSFSLQGIDNKPFDNQSLQGQWTYLFFGFTHCGTICPTTLAEMAKMVRLLESQNIRPQPKIVFISLDPARDNLAKLKKYTQAFDPNFYAAIGEPSDLEKMTEELGVAYEKVEQAKAQNAKENNENGNKDYNKDYNIEHTGTLMLFNPEGALQAFFTTPHQAEWLAEDYQMLAQASELSMRPRR